MVAQSWDTDPFFFLVNAHAQGMDSLSKQPRLLVELLDILGAEDGPNKSEVVDLSLIHI